MTQHIEQHITHTDSGHSTADKVVIIMWNVIKTHAMWHRKDNIQQYAWRHTVYACRRIWILVNTHTYRRHTTQDKPYTITLRRHTYTRRNNVCMHSYTTHIHTVIAHKTLTVHICSLQIHDITLFLYTTIMNFTNCTIIYTTNTTR